MSLPSLALALALSAASANSFYGPEHQSLGPAYLPREVILGTYISGVTTPQLRLQWELTLVQNRHDAFVLLFEGGGGYGLGFPGGLGLSGTDAMTYFYEHTLLAGIGYRAEYPGGFAWGFHIATGPVFYGARFQQAPTENDIEGWIEGGLQAGLRVGGITYGLCIRYASLYDAPVRLQSPAYVGGPFVGLYLDWR